MSDNLVLGGLSTSDSYATTQAKAKGILNGFISDLGANTVRRAEVAIEGTSLTAANDLAIRRALEEAGVEFSTRMAVVPAFAFARSSK